MIGYLDDSGNRKLEVEDWSTYWDDDEHCWMMARHVYTRCGECKGMGETQTPNGKWTCFTCDGKGRELVNIDYENAISCEDFILLEWQRDYLRKRYGTPNPVSIVDYWLAS